MIPDDTAERGWKCQPSVGTWLQKTPPEMAQVECATVENVPEEVRLPPSGEELNSFLEKLQPEIGPEVEDSPAEKPPEMEAQPCPVEPEETVEHTPLSEKSGDPTIC